MTRSHTKLWAVYVNTMDDLIAAPSEKAACDAAAYFRSRVRDGGFTAIEWPYSAEGHAEQLKKWPEHYPPARIATTEAVASVTRIPAPDVADKGAASTRLRDLDQPLLHGMESNAASNSARPGVGSSPAGCGSAHSSDEKDVAP